MNPSIRRQLGHWAARYRTLAAGLLAVAVLVAVFPSVAPVVPGFADGGGPPTASPTTAPVGGGPPPVVPVPVGTIPPSGSAPPPSAPVGGAPGSIAPPPASPDDVVPCPIDLPVVEGATEPLPLADVLNIASPALPLLGPFIPFGLAGLPAIGPVLPIVTPLLPVAQPVLVFLGPLAAKTVGPLAGYEAILLEPIAGPIRDITPDALAQQQQFIAQLQPAIDQITASGLPTCGAIVVGSFAGIIQQVLADLGVESLLEELLGALRGVIGG